MGQAGMSRPIPKIGYHGVYCTDSEQSQRKFEPKMPAYMVYGANPAPADKAKANDDDGWLSDDYC